MSSHNRKYSRDIIPEVLRISFYHEALTYFILQYSDPTIIEELAEAIEDKTLITRLEEYHFLNDTFSINFHTPDSKWFLYQQVVRTIAEEYGVSTDFVTSTTIAIIAAIGGNNEPSISRLWSLFIHNKKDLAHLRLINSELYNWRQSIVNVWKE